MMKKEHKYALVAIAITCFWAFLAGIFFSWFADIYQAQNYTCQCQTEFLGCHWTIVNWLFLIVGIGLAYALSSLEWKFWSG